MSKLIIYDKAEWHLENSFPEDIHADQAYLHAGYYFGWILENGLADERFTKRYSEPIDQFVKREISAKELFKATDGTLAEDMLGETGNAFTADYYDIENGAYFEDYEELLCEDAKTFFHVEDTPWNYAKLCKRVSERYDEWQGIKK